MYGYVSINRQALSEEGNARFRAFYCGLCHTLAKRFGQVSRMTLSYDMTVIMILLSALYEPEETKSRERCFEQPFKTHDYILTECADYAADMSILLAYYKCRDDWQDDKRLDRAAMAQALKGAFEEVKGRHPEKCRVIGEAVKENNRLEKEGLLNIDAAANCTGRIMGEIYAWKDDFWQNTLRQTGHALGRFIYLMDAYEDLERDKKKNKPNPLKALSEKADYEDMMRGILMAEMGVCSECFERLPIVKDADILRNVLYSGVWGRYTLIQKKPEKKNGQSSEQLPQDAAGKE